MPSLDEILPQLSPKWFDRATVYTGSQGDFRYRFKKDKETVSAAVYSGVCYEKAQDVEEQVFPRTDEGVEQLRQWIQARRDDFFSRSGS